MNRLLNSVLSFVSSAPLKQIEGLDPQFAWVQTVVDAIEVVLWPLLIIVAAVGLIWAVVLGVNMARADSTEKREEQKKRLIALLVGIAITIGLILFFYLLMSTILPIFMKKGQYAETENPNMINLLMHR